MTFAMVGTVLGLLGMATGAGHLLKRQGDVGIDSAVVEQFNLRIRSWWMLCAALAAAFLAGPIVTMILFGGLSFWALREFITLTPTRAADHRTLFWVFFVFTPLQYVLVGMEKYGLYSIVIPVYGFLFIPARVALAGDFKRYLERCAKIQAGLMICVYCLSHAPALLTLHITNEPEKQQSSADPATTSPMPPSSQQPPTPEKRNYDNQRLLFFFVLVVVAGDAFCYVSEKLIGKHQIAPAINSNRTWEGFLGGMSCATLFGAALHWATPFDNVLVTAGMSLVITIMGYAGGLTMSAIKRDRGVKDYGTLVEGHGGVLDRIDSICFAAPVFFHFTRLLVATT